MNATQPDPSRTEAAIEDYLRKMLDPDLPEDEFAKIKARVETVQGLQNK